MPPCYRTRLTAGRPDLIRMARKASVLIEQDDNGFYQWCPELNGCQSQGATLEEAIANIKEAIELYLDTFPRCRRAPSRPGTL